MGSNVHIFKLFKIYKVRIEATESDGPRIILVPVLPFSRCVVLSHFFFFFPESLSTPGFSFLNCRNGIKKWDKNIGTSVYLPEIPNKIQECNTDKRLKRN